MTSYTGEERTIVRKTSFGNISLRKSNLKNINLRKMPQIIQVFQKITLRKHFRNEEESCQNAYYQHLMKSTVKKIKHSQTSCGFQCNIKVSACQASGHFKLKTQTDIKLFGLLISHIIEAFQNCVIGLLTNLRKFSSPGFLRHFIALFKGRTHFFKFVRIIAN